MESAAQSEVIRLRRPGPLQVRLRPPGSKSLTNRALPLAALARGTSSIRGALVAEDTELMVACLSSLGVAISGHAAHDDRELRIDGLAGPFVGETRAELFVGTAGTTARFLAALCAASARPVLMDGSKRMRERPMEGLFAALRSQGARIVDRGQPGCLPVAIDPAPGGLVGGVVSFERPQSSQFVSALVLAATLARAPTTLVLRGGTPARPYVDMTLEVLTAFGGHAAWTDTDVLEITPAELQACAYEVEPDASSASYFLALAAIYGGEAEIVGLGRRSLQGDARFAAVLADLGAEVEQTEDTTRVVGGRPLHGLDIDLSDMPDMTLTLANLALFARSPTRIRGVEVLRHHESDRLAAGATELRKLGAGVLEHEDGLTIEPPSGGPREGQIIETYADHRMAMAFSLVGDVVLRDPACTAKTYPGYFEELRKLGMVVSDSDPVLGGS